MRKKIENKLKENSTIEILKQEWKELKNDWIEDNDYIVNDMGYDSKEAYLGWAVLNMATLLGEKAGCKDYVLEHHSNHQEVANLIIDTLDIKEAQKFKFI